MMAGKSTKAPSAPRLRRRRSLIEDISADDWIENAMPLILQLLSLNANGSIFVQNERGQHCRITVEMIEAGQS